MRTKTAYEIIEDDRGRKVPTKIGMKPEQRDGIEYEFDIVGDMDLENTLTVSKSRCPALSGEVVRRPGAEFAEAVMAWLSDGEPVLSARDYRDLALAKGATYQQLRDLYMRVQAAGLLGSAVVDDAGDTMTLGQLIVNKGKEAEAAEVFGAQAAAEAAAVADAAGQGTQDAPAGAGAEDPWQDAPPAPPAPPRIRPEDQGARQPAAPPAAENGAAAARESEFVTSFTDRLAAVADYAAVLPLQRELGAAIRGRVIGAEVLAGLQGQCGAKRRQLEHAQFEHAANGATA
jgi:hypothetical protein